MNAVRAAILDAKKDFSDIDAGLTGRPVLSADEMLTSNSDMTRATIIALIIEAALLHVHITHNFLRHRISVIMRERADGVFFRLDKASLKVALSGKLSVFFGLDMGCLDILRLWTCGSACACTSLRLSLRGWRRACSPRLH